MYFLYLARIFHESASALASPLFSQEIFLSRLDPLVRHFFGKSPEKAKSSANIAVIHELSGLVVDKIDGESFLKRLKLSSASDYRQVFNNNFRVGDTSITILVRTIPGTCPRLGFAIARKQIHRAVDRNRLKRVFRESFRKNQHRLPARDMVIMVRRPILLVDGRKLVNNLEKHWNSVIKQCEKS